jgi:ribosomal protein S18 acetylase RimI-like enzyme
MIKYIISSEDDVELLMQSRLAMLKAVNDLQEDYKFTDELIENSREYFKYANQTTILAIDEKVVGCATMCYIEMMPTFLHPAGKRAHLMNVYTDSQYRRRGIAFQMVSMLINEAKEKGVTEISLDATELGRPLYKKYGFVESNEYMVLNMK